MPAYVTNPRYRDFKKAVKNHDYDWAITSADQLYDIFLARRMFDIVHMLIYRKSYPVLEYFAARYRNHAMFDNMMTALAETYSASDLYNISYDTYQLGYHNMQHLLNHAISKGLEPEYLKLSKGYVKNHYVSISKD